MPCLGKAGVQCLNWDENHAACVRCGFEYNEAKRRKNIPLTPTVRELRSKKLRKVKR